MNKKKAITSALMHSLTILLGAYLAFKVWWSNGDEKFLGLLAFFLLGFGALFLSMSLTRLLIPSNTDFSFSTLTDKTKYQRFKDTIGVKKARRINTISISLFLLLFGGTAYGLIVSLNHYEREQLKTFGRCQKVKINDIHFKGKGSTYAFFDYYLDGKKYSNSLDPKQYKIGDSATIIFSTNNTDIVKWANESAASE